MRIRDIDVSLLLDAIEMAETLGAAAVLIPGCDQEQSPGNGWELFWDGVMRAVGRAEVSGIRLALKAVGKPFLHDTVLLLRMIEECGGSDSLGIYLDVGNSTRGGMDPAAEIRAAGQRSVLCHVKDWNRTDLWSGGWVGAAWISPALWPLWLRSATAAFCWSSCRRTRKMGI